MTSLLPTKINMCNRVSLIHMIRLISILLLILLSSGCVVIPYPTQFPDPNPFPEESLGFIKIGETTREEVWAIFANWEYETDKVTQVVELKPLRSKDDRWWRYVLERELMTWGVTVCFGLGFGGICETYNDDQSHQHHFVLVEFDSNDVVKAAWLTDGDAHCDSSKPICYWLSDFLILASEDVNKSANDFDPVSDACRIYIYAEGDTFTPMIVVSGSRLRGYLFAADTFSYWETEGGSHHVQLQELHGDGHVAEATNITCNHGDVVFANFDGHRLHPVSADEGIPNIRRRFLVDRIAQFF